MPTKKVLCEECNNYLGKKQTIINKFLCNTCKELNKYIVITKTNAKKNYLFKDDDLIDLTSYEGKSSYGPATYYTIEDLDVKACNKYNIHKDNIKEFLSKLHHEKAIKSKERKEKMLITKENKIKKRREKLISELAKVKLQLRSDSVLCKKYIDGTSEYDLEYIIERMCQMKYLFEYCHMDECKQIAYEQQLEEFNAGYFPDCSVFDEAEYIALKKYSNGKYPVVFPWLE